MTSGRKITKAKVTRAWLAIAEVVDAEDPNEVLTTYDREALCGALLRLRDIEDACG